MTVNISGSYLGKKRSEIVHGPTGSKIIVDAPKDNNGEGTTFSPTDLTAASLGACMMTLIAIVAERDGIDVIGMRFEVEKHMASSPRKIASLPIKIYLPKSIALDKRTKIENAALTCPVHKSLHPDIKIEVSFVYEI
jgi:putative redox protein